MKQVPLLAASVALSVILRIGAALALGDSIAELPGIFDQVSYDALARQVLAGHGFSFAATWWPATRAGEPTAHWSFLYTLYLTGVYGIFGEHPLAARLIQAAEIQAELLLVATGRAPNTENVGLETTKAELEKGFVKVDLRTMRTREPHLYAIGDVVGGLMLASAVTVFWSV